MKTDDLIDMLSTNVEPVDHRQIVRNIGMAVAAGAAVAVAIVFFVLGPRAGLSSFATLVSALLKVAVAVAVLIPASIYLIRLARPGGERRAPAVFVAAPFIAVIVLAALEIGRAHV